MKKFLASALVFTLVICCASAFAGGLGSFKDKLAPVEASPEEDFEVDELNDGTVSITSYTGPGGDVIIPAEINGRRVSAIESMAFMFNDSLISVVVPEGVKRIESLGISYCDNLTSITLPSTISFIGENPFVWDISAEITLSGDGDYLELVDGALFSKPDSRMIFYPLVDPRADYAVPEWVEIIDQHAFHGSENLRRVTLPEGLTELRSFAFSECKNLESVALPDGLISIGDGAFASCYALGELELPASVTTLGQNPFRTCKSLRLTVQDGSRFRVADGVLFGSSNTRLIAYSLYLTAEEFAVPDTVVNIDTSAFAGSTYITRVSMPEGVESIGNYAFSGCAQLETVVLPASVAQMGDETFKNCTNVTLDVVSGSYSESYAERLSIAYR